MNLQTRGSFFLFPSRCQNTIDSIILARSKCCIDGRSRHPRQSVYSFEVEEMVVDPRYPAVPIFTFPCGREYKYFIVR